MTLEHVSKFLPEVVRALGKMLNMLIWVADVCGLDARPSVDWRYFGIDIGSSLSWKYWIGTDFGDPELLRFTTQRRIDFEAATNLGVGEVLDGGRWRREAELDSGPIHSYARSKVGQMEWPEEFLRECLERARSIEALAAGASGSPGGDFAGESA